MYANDLFIPPNLKILPFLGNKPLILHGVRLAVCVTLQIYRAIAVQNLKQTIWFTLI
jgi:hypothetical protein